MSVQEIDEAIEQLTPQERSELFARLVERHHEEWDKQIEDDLEAGRLDKWLDEARKEYDAGMSKPLNELVELWFDQLAVAHPSEPNASFYPAELVASLRKSSTEGSAIS